MDPNLSTTNTLLAIMAAVSVLEALAVAALIVGGLMAYRRLGRALTTLEREHVAPAAVRVNAILDDVKGVTAVVRATTESVDAGARSGLAWLLRRLRHWMMS
jgi:hypothetical protein